MIFTNESADNLTSLVTKSLTDKFEHNCTLLFKNMSLDVYQSNQLYNSYYTFIVLNRSDGDVGFILQKDSNILSTSKHNTIHPFNFGNGRRRHAPRNFGKSYSVDIVVLITVSLVDTTSKWKVAIFGFNSKAWR